MGLRASNTVPLTFEDCELPAENLLGEEGEGFKLAMMALDGGRIGIASPGLRRRPGGARRRRCATRKERKAFGQPIGDFQAVAVHARRPSRPSSPRPSCSPSGPRTSRSPGGRSPARRRWPRCSPRRWRTAPADKAVQIHGGYGYIDEFPVERYLRDARVQTIYEGTSEIQRLVIARELLRAAEAEGLSRPEERPTTVTPRRSADAVRPARPPTLRGCTGCFARRVRGTFWDGPLPEGGLRPAGNAFRIVPDVVFGKQFQRR